MQYVAIVMIGLISVLMGGDYISHHSSMTVSPTSIPIASKYPFEPMIDYSISTTPTETLLPIQKDRSISPTPIMNISISPENIPTQAFIPTITLTPTTFPSPTIKPTVVIVPTKDTTSQLLRDRIDKINQTIANYQSNIDHYLEQEKIQCNKTTSVCVPLEPAPGPSTGQVIYPSCALIDPMIIMRANTFCSTSFFNQINDAKLQINLLEKEKNQLLSQ